MCVGQSLDRGCVAASFAGDLRDSKEKGGVRGEEGRERPRGYSSFGVTVCLSHLRAEWGKGRAAKNINQNIETAA